jgi:cytochrome c-type biogenesis protein CcmH
MMKRFAFSLLLMMALLAAPSAHAVQPDEVMADPAREARARSLSRNLRCMVCQNQSIDDSDAPLARDLRLLVRERIGAGDSDAQVIDFLVARYGEFVLLKPRFETQTLLLWLAPPLALLLGVAAVVANSRRRRVVAADAPLSPEEQSKLAEITAKAGVPDGGPDGADNITKH